MITFTKNPNRRNFGPFFYLPKDRAIGVEFGGTRLTYMVLVVIGCAGIAILRSGDDYEDASLYAYSWSGKLLYRADSSRFD